MLTTPSNCDWPLTVREAEVSARPCWLLSSHRYSPTSELSTSNTVRAAMPSSASIRYLEPLWSSRPSRYLNKGQKIKGAFTQTSVGLRVWVPVCEQRRHLGAGAGVYGLPKDLWFYFFPVARIFGTVLLLAARTIRFVDWARTPNNLLKWRHEFACVSMASIHIDTSPVRVRDCGFPVNFTRTSSFWADRVLSNL